VSDLKLLSKANISPPFSALEFIATDDPHH